MLRKYFREGGALRLFAKVNSMGLFGLNAFPVEAEISVSKGLPRFEIVGLPDAAV